MFVLAGNTEYDNPRVRPGRVLRNIGEVRIKGDEDPVLGGTDFCDFWVGTATEFLINYRYCIVAVTHEELDDFDGEVFVGLESHGEFQAGRAITRSRARSAAYANAALIASTLMVG